MVDNRYINSLKADMAEMETRNCYDCRFYRLAAGGARCVETGHYIEVERNPKFNNRCGPEGLLWQRRKPYWQRIWYRLTGRRP